MSTERIDWKMGRIMPIPKEVSTVSTKTMDRRRTNFFLNEDIEDQT